MFFLWLPMGHEAFVIQRLPWVTICIAAVCTVIQVRACAVEGELLREAISIQIQIGAIESEVFREYHERDADALTGMESMTKLLSDPQKRKELESRAREMQQELRGLLEDFRDGKLCEPDDPMLTRLRVLDRQLEEVTNRIPHNQLGYRTRIDGRIRMLTYAFAHGGWLHLLGNLWFLYLVGCNLEDRWGRWRFLAFYLAGAVTAAAFFKMWHPDSELPLVGASGAIAACMGAFMVVYATARVRFFYFIWVIFLIKWGTITASAYVALAIYALTQAVYAYFESGTEYTSVAYSAHLGGFVMGAAVAGVWKLTGFDEKLQQEVEEEQVAFREDPAFEEASELILQGRKREAMEKLGELVSRRPDHQQALGQMVTLSHQLGDEEATVEASALLIGACAVKGEHDRVVAAYQQLSRFGPQELALDDRSLQLSVRAARAIGDPSVAVEALNALEEKHPKSPLIARSLWDAAELFRQRGHQEQAAEMLREIAKRFPMDPIADQARRRLAGKG
jgi:membrane associated rhomboid family serine protease